MLLVVQVDVEPEWEEELNRWYNEEHMAERLEILGYLNGRRFIAVEGQPKYLATYEVESPDVLFSEAYNKILNNQTDWTRRVLVHVHGNRVVYRQIFPQWGPLPASA